MINAEVVFMRIKLRYSTLRAVWYFSPIKGVFISRANVDIYFANYQSKTPILIEE